MLVLSRKLGEKIFIGESICVTVVDIDRGKIRLGIEAPRDVPIYRQELPPVGPPALPAPRGSVSRSRMSAQPPRPDPLEAEILRLTAEVVRESAATDSGWGEDDRGWRPVNRPKPDRDWTQDDYRNARANSRRLCRANEFAISGLQKRVNYCVGTGFKYAVEPRPLPGGQPSGNVVRDVAEFVEAFCELNALDTLPGEALRLADEEGSAVLRLFNSGGLPDVRMVAADSIYTPPGLADDPGVTCGIVYAVRPNGVTDRQDVLGAHIDGEFVPEAELVHVKFNARLTEPLGRPTYYPVEANLYRCEDSLRAMSTTVKVRAKLAVILKLASLTNRTEDDLKRRLTERTQRDAEGHGIPTLLERLPFGMALRLRQGDDAVFPAANIGAADAVAVLQAELRAVSVLLDMPEWMFTGLADQRYSNAFVVEAPTLKAFSRIQKTLTEAFGEGRMRQRASLIWRAIRIAVANGHLPYEALSAVKITVTPPSLESRDKSAEAGTNKTYIDAGVKSVPTVQKELGLDPETEKKNGAAPANAAPGTPTPAGGGTPPGQPGGLPGVAPPTPESARLTEPRDPPPWAATLSDRLGVVESLAREARDRSHLVQATITDKNGVRRRVWVRPNQAPAGGDKPKRATPEEKATAKSAAAKAVSKPAELSDDDLKALPGHLSKLTVPELKELRKSAGAKGGTLKADIIDRIRGHVGAKRLSEPRDGKKPAATPAAGSLAGEPAKVPHTFSSPSPNFKADAERLFGRPVSEDDLAAVAMAVPGIKVAARADTPRGGLNLEGDGGGVESYREIYRDDAGKLACYNSSIVVDKKKLPPGTTGTSLFADQVRALRNLGVSRIDTHAVGSPGDTDENGYYTWPRLGYSGPMSEEQVGKLPADIRQQLGGKRDVRDLFDLPGGADAWKKHGSKIKLTFDLSDGSRNMTALQAYLAERAARPKG